MLQTPPFSSYGISQNSRLVLILGFLLFVLGGSFSVIGVAVDDQLKWIGGIVILIIGVAVYTLTIMLTEVTGPPSGFDLQDFESVYKIKPASFHPNRESRVILFVACILFALGSTMVVSGFKFFLLYLWIPGYSMCVIGFVIYTAVVLYGPLKITPGAIIVAFPDDLVPAQGEERDHISVHSKSALRGSTSSASKASTGLASTRPQNMQETKRLFESDYDACRGYLGFKKYEHCPRGYTPRAPPNAVGSYRSAKESAYESYR